MEIVCMDCIQSRKEAEDTRQAPHTANKVWNNNI